MDKDHANSIAISKILDKLQIKPEYTIMGFTKREEKVMKDNGMHKSSSRPDTYVGNNGYCSAKREGDRTIFDDGDKKYGVSLKRLDEKTRK